MDKPTLCLDTNGFINIQATTFKLEAWSRTYDMGKCLLIHSFQDPVEMINFPMLSKPRFSDKAH